MLRTEIRTQSGMLSWAVVALLAVSGCASESTEVQQQAPLGGGVAGSSAGPSAGAPSGLASVEPASVGQGAAGNGGSGSGAPGSSPVSVGEAGRGPLPPTAVPGALGSGGGGAGGMGVASGGVGSPGAGGQGVAMGGAGGQGQGLGAGGTAVAGAGGQVISAPMGGGGGMATVPPGPVQHHVMAIEYPGRLVEISAEGAKLWEHKTPSLAIMFSVLPNGNVFYPHGGNTPGAQEVDKTGAVVWEYTSMAGELLGGEALANGNRLLGEGGPPVVLELDAAAQVVRSIPFETSGTKAHTQVRHVHRLDNGNVLMALEGEGAAREIDAQGATVWERTGVKSIHEVIRLASGNTLISAGKKLFEVEPAGDVVWEFGESDAPELGIKWLTSIQILKNGNFLVGNWVGSGGGDGVHALEITRDKEVVWTLDDHELLKSATTVTALDD